MNDSFTKPYTRITILLVVSLYVLVGCMPAKYAASPEQQEGVQKVYREGIELLVSRKENSGMAAGINRYEEGKPHMQLIVIIQNNGKEPFNVLPDSIDVVHRREDETQKLEIYPQDEAVDKVTFDARFSAAINAAAAAYNQNTDIDTELNENMAEASALEAVIKGRDVQKTLLRKETLFEGDRVYGVAYFAVKKEGQLEITIPAGDDSHTFYFNSVDD